ncbi:MULTISPECIES: ABC transporter ATP-binding protein [Kosakonia]|jgi:putative ABC transport system ATP-binding protein|uniref:ABC transporter n=1 Tax=Kosakonia cowanii JCM 10956 = DSM 18146 TaxID=1300165 RepID=A0A807LFZ4_9ENTR|nr:MULTISPECIES: ABC transporter ATP-binding protein [Kosakonia]MDP9771010.1 putative ABC transport system ATP-binding protein [Atlantibacter hermannii]APZ05526.1 ABC transporter [Kosakonia cowanii] [Kosakonia cowanii JCM 10956 = DSM 18146]MDF2623825.1 transporter [Kosakonia cowanii]MDM9618466.1 ABC transporter ATP-binding protein [Kosakonia cowanii]MDP4561934.1 ABC transporter ATP-binding protein [Kosakonia cowanii]
MWAVEMEGISKKYLLGQVWVDALKDVTLNIAANRFTVLSGQSGSGKTTLLNLIGGIDRPDSGYLTIAGQPMAELDDDQCSDFRARHLGFIFQNFNLIPVLTVRENIEVPLLIQHKNPAYRQQRIDEMLDNVGLAHKADSLPNQLSGGQRQRVAIARALIHRPALIVADEPTANLDSKTGAAILQLLRHLQREYAVTVVFSSHDPQVIAAADDLYVVHDGSVTRPAMV